MELQYSRLGRECMELLRESTANAKKIQKEQLLNLLEQNKNTAYGQKYGFGEIHSVQEYQQRIPISEYADYDAYIQSMMEGQTNQLTAKDPIYYCISSGSTSLPKYLPMAEEDMLVHYHYTYGVVFGMVKEYYSNQPEDEVFGKIVQTGEFVKTFTDGGVMNGIRSSSIYQWLDQDETFDTSAYTVPREVLFPTELRDLTYVKVRFALAERNVTAIHSVFIHHVTGMMQYIFDNWELLLSDMEHGTVDPRIDLNEEWRNAVVGWLPPDPVRAAELRQLDRETMKENMIQKIWKDMRFIVAIGGNAVARYVDQYRMYAGTIPTHHFVYGASEGMMAISSGLDQPNSYILLPRAGFFEFLPVETPDEETAVFPLTLDDLEVGKRYELIYTNHSGLYRYQMKDVIRVEGFYDEAPLISFCYRKNQLLNIADEKTNTEQMEQAIEAFEKTAALGVTGYCVQADFTVTPGRYLVYLECAQSGGPGREQEFERCLEQANYGYYGCRIMGQIAPVRLAYLRPGAFRRYKQLLVSKGYEMGQSKPVRVLTSEESQSFFRNEVQQYGAEVT